MSTDTARRMGTGGRGGGNEEAITSGAREKGRREEG
jgi:hypothetical protein